MLSILKHSFIGLGSILLSLFALSFCVKADDVLEFYRDRASVVAKTQNPFEAGTSFIYTAKTTLSRIERGGDVIALDSAMISYFVSFGEVDSTIVLKESKNGPDRVDISYPNIFEDDYDFNFFPNDTGGEFISIGFDADTTKGNLPSGLAVIDRNLYFLKRLYLHYPNKTRYKRRSKEVEFTKYEGLIFPSRIEENFGKAGITSVDFYRLRTTLAKIEIIQR